MGDHEVLGMNAVREESIEETSTETGQEREDINKLYNIDKQTVSSSSSIYSRGGTWIITSSCKRILTILLLYCGSWVWILNS